MLHASIDEILAGNFNCIFIHNFLCHLSDEDIVNFIIFLKGCLLNSSDTAVIHDHDKANELHTLASITQATSGQNEVNMSRRINDTTVRSPLNDNSCKEIQHTGESQKRMIPKPVNSIL